MFFLRTDSDAVSRFRAGIVLFVCILFFVSLFFFIISYSANTNVTIPIDFYLTFYVFFTTSFVASLLLLFSKNIISSLLLFLLALSSISVANYSLTDWLTIRIWMISAFFAVLLVKIPWPINIVGSIPFALFFTVSQKIPLVSGENSLAQGGEPFSLLEQISFALILILISISVSCIGYICEMLDKMKERNKLLNGTITKLTEFNQSLQAYARVADEVAAKKERFRLSREIHDISGYIFTNIIALMDAIISTGCQDIEKTSEICMIARIQAQEGLQETRRALRAFRSNESKIDRGLRAVFKIKKIFEETTGVEVKIESGNLPNSFGESIDLVLYRTVQEALTNALRHGLATKVTVDLRVAESFLFMTVLDNGSGAKKITKGIGLSGMEERITELGGNVDASNAIEGGFKLTVKIPISEKNQTLEEVYDDSNTTC